MGAELSMRIDRLLAIPTEQRWQGELFQAYSDLLIVLNNYPLNFSDETAHSRERSRMQDCQRKVLEIEQLFESTLSEQWANLLSEGSPLSRFFYRIYQRMVSGELKSLDGSQGRMCQVGVGAMPLSILLYLQKTSFVVTGIDSDHSAIVKAQQGLHGALSALDIPAERLNLVEADGVEFDYGSYDVVVVSMTVSPRSRVVQRILDTCRQPQLRIVLRDTEGWKQFIYRPVGLPAQDALALVAHHVGCPISSAVYSVRSHH